MRPPQSYVFPFESSFAALARLAFSETRATGYALFARAAEGLHRLSALGSDISAEALNGETSHALVTHCLQHDGLVAFSFREPAASAEAKEQLDRLFEAMRDLWAARHIDTRLLTLLARLTAAETRLIDSKIADRAEGLLAGNRQSDRLHVLLRHVSTVLRPGPAFEIIEKLVHEREDELEERRVTSQAKAILQATRSISEDQAYTHLRTLSRKSRRRLKEVALAVIDDATIAAA